MYRIDQPTVSQSYRAILAAGDKVAIEVEAAAPTAEAILNMKYSMAAYGAHFCEVRVHAHTRQVKVRRFVSAYDCGRSMNPKTAESQIIGGIIIIMLWVLGWPCWKSRW